MNKKIRKKEDSILSKEVNPNVWITKRKGFFSEYNRYDLLILAFCIAANFTFYLFKSILIVMCYECFVSSSITAFKRIRMKRQVNHAKKIYSFSITKTPFAKGYAIHSFHVHLKRQLAAKLTDRQLNLLSENFGTSSDKHILYLGRYVKWSYYRY